MKQPITFDEWTQEVPTTAGNFLLYSENDWEPQLVEIQETSDGKRLELFYMAWDCSDEMDHFYQNPEKYWWCRMHIQEFNPEERK